MDADEGTRVEKVGCLPFVGHCPQSSSWAYARLQQWKCRLRHAGMDSRHPGPQGCFRKHPCRPASTPRWNDAIEEALLGVTEVPPTVFSKEFLLEVSGQKCVWSIQSKRVGCARCS